MNHVIYELWDVFTTEPFVGNPLAVVPDAEGLSEAQMQRIAKEFNLSETSFVLPSRTADLRARYFTPSRELPMAGHPSVGTVFSLDKRGVLSGKNKVTLELGIGPVEMTLEREGDVLTRAWMDQGVPDLLQSFDRAVVAEALGLSEAELEPDMPVQLGSAGNTFMLVPVKSVDTLGQVQVSPTLLAGMFEDSFPGVLIFTPHAPESDIRARMFAITRGVYEDPATGSAHGPLGAYLAAHTDILRGSLQGDSAEFVSHQGVEMGRRSELFVHLKRKHGGTQVFVGGAAVQVGEGTLFL